MKTREKTMEKDRKWRTSKKKEWEMMKTREKTMEKDWENEEKKEKRMKHDEN